MYFERERIELPDGAVQGNHIDIEWLKQASLEEQREALFQWFTNQYEDPVESLPYDSREGGYIPIHGALVDPFDEFGEFGDIVSDEVIDDVAQELFDIAGDMWSPRPSFEDFETLDGKDDSDISSSSEVIENLLNNQKSTITNISKFEIRINRVMSLIDNQEDFLIKASVFSLLITAFETYLWEVTKENIENEKLRLDRFLIENMGEFNKKMTLSEIYTRNFNIKERLIDVLDHETVWHNINNIKLIFEKGFMLDSLPEFSKIQKALKKRHNIVHRFGMNIDGYEMPLTKEDIIELKTDLTLFIHELEQKINDRLASL